MLTDCLASSDLKIALRPPYPPALREDVSAETPSLKLDEMADAFGDSPQQRYTLWWKRINEDDVLTPLRTTINPDGTSHGPRIHPRDARQISIREAARMQGRS